MRQVPGRLRRAGLAAASAAVLAATGADGRPAEVEDLLRREAFGAVQADSTGRWLALERRRPYQAAARFDLDTLDELARTTLWRVDLRRPGPARPLLRADARTAYGLGPFAPDGRRLAVYRLTGRNWELGVVTLSTGRTRWLGVTPERINDARTVQWASAAALLVVARPPGDLPEGLRVTRNAALALPDRWRRSARGEAVVTVYGSGRYLGLRPQAPPNRLWRIDAASGARRELAAGPFVDLALSPDGGRVALVAVGGDIPMDPAHPVQGAYGYQNRFRRLRLLDLQTGRMTEPCPGCDLVLHPLAWSPSSREVLIFARRDGEPWTAGHLLRVDAAAGTVRRADQGVAPCLDLRPEAARAGWLGEDPLVWGVRAGAPAAGRPGWFKATPGGPVSVTAGLAAPSREAVTVAGNRLLLAADGDVWTLDGQGRRTLAAPGVQPVGFGHVTRLWSVDYDLPLGGALLGRRAGAQGDELVRVSAAGARPVVRLPPGAEPLPAVSADGALVRTVTAAGERLLWVRAGGPPVVIVTLNRYLADLDPPTVRAVRHPGPDGAPLTSWLVLPRRPPGGPPPPLIVRPYLGLSYPTPPTDADFRRAGDPTPSLLAAQGYAVLLPSLPALKAGGGPMDGLADRILGIVDAAADPATRGTFDPDRLGLWGMSFGGYTALAAITQTDRFKAAIAQAATSDLFGEWAAFTPRGALDPTAGLSSSFNQGWVEDLQGDMRGPPWADPERYLRNSPAWHADRIHTPVLLLHGEQDGFSPAQAQAMFSALLRQNKDAVLAVYWGQGHVIGGPGDLRDLYARAFGWFERYLPIASETRLGPEATPSSPVPRRRPVSSGPHPPEPNSRR